MIGRVIARSSRYGLVVLALGAWPVATDAQRAPVRNAPKETLKEGTPPVAARQACPPREPATAPTDAQRRQARDLAQRGQQAALLGDSASAREQWRQAALLDPSDANLAYRLARSHEAAGAATAALSEYCRFIELAPDAPEIPEARDRVAALARPTMSAAGVGTASAFQDGVAAFRRGDLIRAEAAFTTVITREPAWADAFYDRAMVLFARGAADRASRDLEQYLRLKPEADDRAAVTARLASLRRATLSPETALSAGLVVPGGGQFYTRRPGRAALSLAGFGAAIAVGVVQRTTTTSVEQNATDPFGNAYTFTTTVEKRDRPYLIPGVAAAGAIAVGSAIDAFFYARRFNGPAQRVSLGVRSVGGRPAAAITVR
jgi:tetratricopeptide (TPR) repeat protein